MKEIFEPHPHITVWVDGGIHIRTSDPHGDPVELSEDQALALAALLQKLVEQEQG